MPWIASHQSLSRHRKTLCAAAALRTDRHKLIGHLHELWWWALDNADAEGRLGGVSLDVLAEAAGWPVRDADRFVEALRQAGFLDLDGGGGYVLHDWYDYAGKLLDRRTSDRQRQRASRARAPAAPANRVTQRTEDADNRVTSAGRPRDNRRTIGGRPAVVRRTSNARVPESTGEYRTGVSDETPGAPDAPPEPDAVEAVYAHFKARIAPRSRLCPRKRIAARLTRFSADELKLGIDHFAEDWWWMEHNGARGADWFFESDARSEQFLLLAPRRAPVPAGANGLAQRDAADGDICANPGCYRDPDLRVLCSKARHRGAPPAAPAPPTAPAAGASGAPA